jgi:serine/threonine-protein kinase
LLQACEAIAEAHALGIVHRDLKPSNLFVTRQHGTPLVKVLDFGLAKRLGNTGPLGSITSTTATMGSPLYMSPEQMQSTRDVDLRTDIWALGAILYELTTGVPPFAATSIPELVMKLLTTSQAPVASVLPTLPAELAQALDSLIGRCLEKDRERRFATVTDFARALAPLAPPRARVSLERIAGVLPATDTAAERAAAALASTASGQTVTARGVSRLPVHRGALWLAAPIALGVLAWIVRTNTHTAAASIEPNAQPVVSSAEATAARQVAPKTAPEIMPVDLPPLPSASPSTSASASVAVTIATPAVERTTRAPKVVKKTTRRQPTGKVDVYDDRK